jgi:hypothetical protein
MNFGKSIVQQFFYLKFLKFQSNQYNDTKDIENLQI